MICPHCGKEFKRIPKPKLLFGIMCGYRHSCFIDGSHTLPEYRRSETWSEWNSKIKYSSNSLREMVEKFKTLDLSEDSRKIACIVKLIDVEYIPGRIYEFPDGTFAWVIEPYIPQSSSNYRGTVIEKMNIFWRFRIWTFPNFEESIVVCDPKAELYFFRYLYALKDKKTNRTPDLKFPPLYDKYLELTPNAHIDPSKYWDSIINTVWIKPIIDFVRDFNVDQTSVEWKKLVRRGSGKYG